MEVRDKTEDRIKRMQIESIRVLLFAIVETNLLLKKLKPF